MSSQYLSDFHSLCNFLKPEVTIVLGRQKRDYSLSDEFPAQYPVKKRARNMSLIFPWKECVDKWCRLQKLKELEARMSDPVGEFPPPSSSLSFSPKPGEDVDNDLVTRKKQQQVKNSWWISGDSKMLWKNGCSKIFRIEALRCVGKVTIPGVESVIGLFVSNVRQVGFVRSETNKVKLNEHPGLKGLGKVVWYGSVEFKVEGRSPEVAYPSSSKSGSKTRKEMLNQKSLVEPISGKSFKRSRKSLWEKTPHLTDLSSNNNLDPHAKDQTHFRDHDTYGLSVDNIEEVPLRINPLTDISSKNDYDIPAKD
ncbi:unnamed protein product [Lepeophtheirus salmonis]|uniref:(salmon louse) hypothetical protein n=1 Tax=Lepeophtheirus salmonis TaxID=72036 RepID=A0A7R8CMT9_LEPSM|nr:unnamed protein product [Lepeophtheirus salmonis]CAF2869348.1 unnamed protein product [Lepeophtheirus salmonis]